VHHWFGDEQVVQTIADNFIALAIDTRYTVDTRYVEPRGEIYEFLTNTGIQGNDSLVSITARGAPLAKAINRGHEILKALEEWAQLPEEERAPGAYKVEPALPTPIRFRKDGPFQNRPAPPPGGLILKCYTRALARDENGHYQRDAFPFDQSPPITAPQHDFLWLTKAEWQSLIPADVKEGAKFPVPDTIAVRLFCCNLLHPIRQSAAWCPEDIRSGELNLTVECVSPARIHMRLDGFANIQGSPLSNSELKPPENGTAGYEAQLLGFLTYDREKKAFSGVEVVALGDYWDDVAETQAGQRWIRPGRNPLGIAVVLAADTAADHVPPRMLTPPAETFGDYYKPHVLNKP
jgi:hypothetical protein